jgi:dihydroflavonol-4-reductase
MTVVVTGASGHVGANLVRTLLAQGRHVRALIHRDQRALEGLDIERVPGDVRDLASLERAFAGAEVVYHAAGFISILRSEWLRLEATNVLGTRHVVEACLRQGVRRLVYFCSIHAFQQEPLDEPLDESRPLVGMGHSIPYDRSKAAAHHEIEAGLARGLDAVIVFPTGILGPHDDYPSHFGQFLLALARGQMPLLVPGGFDWVDVRDVAQGALLAEQHAPVGGRYLLSGHWVSVCDLATMAEEVTGRQSPRGVCPTPLAFMGAPFVTAYAKLCGLRPIFTSVSLEALRGNRIVLHDRATRDLGYAPRPFRETLADTYHWFREHGDLPENSNVPVQPGA